MGIYNSGRLVLASVLAFALSACGGGGSTPAPVVPPTVSGVATSFTVGAADSKALVKATVANALVTIKDSLGNTKTTQTAADGSYSIDVSGLTPPFRLALGPAGSATAYSLANAAGTANINGLTTTAFNQACIARNTTAAATFTQAGFGQVPPELNSYVAALQALIRPALTVNGFPTSANFDPFTSVFVPGDAAGKALAGTTISSGAGDASVTVEVQSGGTDVYKATSTFTTSCTGSCNPDGSDASTTIATTTTTNNTGAPNPPPSQTVTPPTGTLQFSGATYTVAETGTSATITVTRADGNAGAASVHYATSNGTAVAGTDYTATSGNLNWAVGETGAKTFSVPVTDDHLVNGTRTVNLALSAVTGATLGTQTTAVLSITDNDVAGTLQFSAATYTVSEAGTSIVINVTRTGGNGGNAASVHFATADGSAHAGTDYVASSGTLNWEAGDTGNKPITITVNNDNIANGTRTVNLSLTSATGSTLGTQSTAVLSINDDEGPAGTLQFSAATYSVGEAAGTVTITVTRINGSGGAASVHYATAPGTATTADYTPISDTVLNWASGEAGARTFTVAITNDTAVEGNESFSIGLTNAAGAALGTPSSATVTITDDDVAGTLQFSSTAYSVNEKDGNATITVTRTGNGGGAASVHYAASNGTGVLNTDYSAPTGTGTLNWPSGDAASKTFNVPIIDRGLTSGTKTVNLTLSAFTGAAQGTPTAAVLTINDNDVVAFPKDFMLPYGVRPNNCSNGNCYSSATGVSSANLAAAPVTLIVGAFDNAKSQQVIDLAQGGSNQRPYSLIFHQGTSWKTIPLAITTTTPMPTVFSSETSSTICDSHSDFVDVAHPEHTMVVYSLPGQDGQCYNGSNTKDDTFWITYTDTPNTTAPTQLTISERLRGGTGGGFFNTSGVLQRTLGMVGSTLTSFGPDFKTGAATVQASVTNVLGVDQTGGITSEIVAINGDLKRLGLNAGNTLDVSSPLYSLGTDEAYQAPCGNSCNNKLTGTYDANNLYVVIYTLNAGHTAVISSKLMRVARNGTSNAVQMFSAPANIGLNGLTDNKVIVDVVTVVNTTVSTKVFAVAKTTTTACTPTTTCTPAAVTLVNTSSSVLATPTQASGTKVYYSLETVTGNPNPGSATVQAFVIPETGGTATAVSTNSVFVGVAATFNYNSSTDTVSESLTHALLVDGITAFGDTNLQGGTLKTYKATDGTLATLMQSPIAENSFWSGFAQGPVGMGGISVNGQSSQDDVFAFDVETSSFVRLSNTAGSNEESLLDN